MATFIEKARPLIERGVPVFPCGSDKAPLAPGGFKSATTDASQIAAWGKARPNALVGIPTGERQTFVLDIDHHADGPDGFATLAANGWKLPFTRGHTTRSGGGHAFFRVPNGCAVRSSAGRLGPGLDIRGAGGYIIWWPGEGLPVVNPTTIADPPDWLLTRLEEIGSIVRADGAAHDTTPAQTAPITALPPGLAVNNDDLGGGPLGLSAHEIDAILGQLNPDAPYDQWLAIGQALHHETNGSQAGLDTWVEWSARSKKFPGGDALASKWGSFGKRDDGHEITMRSVIRMARAATQGGALDGPGQDGVPATATRFRFGDGMFVAGRDGLTFDTVDSNNEPHSLWICSPLRVLAKTRDSRSDAWGRLVRWADADGRVHEWSLPLAELQGDGLDVRRELARQGLVIAPGKRARDLLTSALQVWPVEKRARCVERLGWHAGVYVLPGEVIGASDELTVFQNSHSVAPAFATVGTMEQWRDSVATLAGGNSRIVFAISLALAAPLADVVGEDGGGFHLRGASSTGKTTALHVAASVWGDPREYCRSWRTTSNGLEGLAALHNDGLLILDELSQVDPREAGESAYLLANGQGKARATRNGTARQAAHWRLLFLSAGEESLAGLMGRAGRKATAGMETRLAEIDADAGAGLGLFEERHDQPTPAALALALKDAASRCHGAIGLAWLRFIVTARPRLGDIIADGIKRFVDEAVPPDAGGQALRVARRFALVAAAGELATAFNLTGWAKGAARAAARKCFDSWLAGFGGGGNRETLAILSQVRGFFEAHGQSRFALLDDTLPDERTVINRAGFVRRTADGTREYLVLPEAFKKELCAGYDIKLVTKVLIAAGWLIPPAGDSHVAQRQNIVGMGRTRVYVLTARMWEADE